jgi:hypothetical protein
MTTPGPTSAYARQCVVPCEISCCNAASTRAPTHLCTNLYDWECEVYPNNIAKLTRLWVNKGVLNKIMLTMSSQLPVHGVQLVDPWQEALRGKVGWYAILGCGEEVPLGVEVLCGHSHETIAVKGAWTSASTMTLWHTIDTESPNVGPAWPV